MPLTKEQLDATVEDAMAQRLKGNEFFKEGKLVDALREYHGVLLKLKGTLGVQEAFQKQASGTRTQGAENSVSSHYPSTDNVDINGKPKDGETKPESEMTVQEKIRSALTSTYLNQAAVQIKLGKHKRALECAQSALALDEKNTKAKFREAQARIGLGEIGKGKRMLQDLQKEKPDAAITSALKQLELDDKARIAKSNSQFKGMYSKKSSESTGAKVTQNGGPKITEIIDAEP